MRFYRGKEIYSWIGLVFIFILILLNLHYQLQQDLYVLESNNLKSRENIVFKTKDNLDWFNKIENSNENLWVISERKNEKFVLLNLYSPNIKDIKLPISSGKNFKFENSMEALVGKNIQVSNKDNNKYFEYASKKYKVIGTLGISENSPLSNVVLINEVELLRKEEILILNGEGIEKIGINKAEQGENKGVERLLGITKFSRLINLSVTSISIISTVLWIYFFCFTRQNKYRIYRILGVRDIKIYFMELKILLLIFLGAIITVFPILKYLEVETVFVTKYLLLYMIVFGGFSYIFWRERSQAYE